MIWCNKARVDLAIFLSTYFFDGQAFTEFAGTRIHTRHTHGTGCTFSAAVTAGLASGMEVEQAVGRARAFIQAAIEDSLELGSGHGPTNHWAYQRRNG